MLVVIPYSYETCDSFRAPACACPHQLWLYDVLHPGISCNRGANRSGFDNTSPDARPFGGVRSDYSDPDKGELF